MSLILDALNRSSQDEGQVPGLGTVHYQQRAERDAGAGPRQLLLVAALVIAVMVIAWLLLDRRPAPVAITEPGQRVAQSESRPGAVTASATTTSPPAAVPLPEARPVLTPSTAAVPAATVPRPASPPAQAPEGVAASTPATAPAAAPQNRQAAAAVGGRGSAATTAQRAAVAELYRQQRSTGTGLDVVAAPDREESARGKSAARKVTARRDEQPVDIEQVVLLAREEMKNASLGEHDAPFIVALSQQAKDRIPTLLYSRHDYSGNPGQSSVVLNGKALKVGASSNGVKVEEILPDSVVLSFQGTRFRLRALNSWVNL
jgi:hypothetical protein